MIGRRLKLARIAAGLSLRDLSEVMDGRVSAQAISKYERNEDMPSSDVLLALAAALRTMPDYLLSPDDLEIEEVEFRRKAIGSERELASVTAQTLQLVEGYLAVEDALGIDSAGWRVDLSPLLVVGSVEEAERAAQALREAWELGVDPIFNLSELLEDRGIKILEANLPSQVDGWTALVRRSDDARLPVIIIRADAWSERKRFTLAHELGHYVLQVGDKKLAEAVANRFAGAFMMPAEAIWREVGRRRHTLSMPELMALKKLFGMSIQAIAYRCKDLGIIARGAMSSLFKLFLVQGWRDPPFEEPGAIDPEFERPRRMRRLCLRALDEGSIGLSRAAELLGMPASVLAERYADPAFRM